MHYRLKSPLEFAVETAKAAGGLLIERFFKEEKDVSLKTDGTIVTRADLEIDEMIRSRITQRFPEDSLYSEEIPHQAGLASDSPHLWVIDPIDGTTNFALGLSIWGVLIARLKAGLPEFAAMYFPLLDELYTVQRNKGAYCNGKRIHTQPPSAERPYSFFACCSRTFRHYQVSIRYKARILGSAAYSFCCLARGAAVIAFESTPKIWDIAGPWLLVEEANGAIATLDSTSPFPFHPEATPFNQVFPTLAAASSQLLEKARAQIKPKS